MVTVLTYNTSEQAFIELLFPDTWERQAPGISAIVGMVFCGLGSLMLPCQRMLAEPGRFVHRSLTQRGQRTFLREHHGRI
jgi:hypothetical protein